MRSRCGVFFSTIEIGRQLYSSNTSAPATFGTRIPIWAYLVALVLALLITYLALKSVQSQRKERQREMRELAASAVERLISLDLSEAAKDQEFIRTCAVLAACDPDTIRVRASFYGNLEGEALKHYMPIEPKLPARSHFVSLLTDLPPRWIFDCATKRRKG